MKIKMEQTQQPKQTGKLLDLIEEHLAKIERAHPRLFKALYDNLFPNHPLHVPADERYLGHYD